MPSTTKHKIELTLDQLIVVRQVCTESRDRLMQVLADPHIKAEYDRRGDEGAAEWVGMEAKCAILSDAVLVM